MVLNCNVIVSSAITVLICGAVVYFCHKRLLTIEQSVNKQNQVLAAFIANMQKDIQIGGTCGRNISNLNLNTNSNSNGHDLASEEAKSKLIVLNRNERDDDDDDTNRNKSNSSTNSSSKSSYAPIEVSSDDEEDEDDDESNTDDSSEDDDENENEDKTPTMMNEEIIVGDFEKERVLTDSWVKVIDVDISSIPQSSQLPIERMIVLKQEQEDQEDDDMQRLLHESMFECLTGSSMNMGGGAAFVMSSSTPMPMNISAMFQAHLRERDEQPPQNMVSSIVEIIDTDDSISDVSSASSALAATSVIEVKPNSIKSEYSAMKVDDLRKIIVEQSLTSKENAKKLKKQEILDLLSLKK
jgi:hypothetical protein